MPTPVPIRPMSEDQWSAILDLQGHEACPGVEIAFGREVRAASAEGPRLHATVYRPVEGMRPAAGLVAFHGGGYGAGDPNGCGALAKTLALGLGVVTVSASYRLGSAAQPSTFALLRDAGAAWVWVREQAAELGIDPARVAVHGESAGCLLAGHLAVASPWVAGALMGNVGPRAAYVFWGPLDFVARWYDNGENPGAEQNVLGPGGFVENPAGYHQLSPLTHARCVSLPPALFVYGRGDPVVHARQGRLAEAAWKRAGAHAETLILPNIGHGVVGDNRAQRRRFLEKALEFGAWRHAGG